MSTRQEKTGSWAWIILGVLMVLGLVTFIMSRGSITTVNNENATSTSEVMEVINEEDLKKDSIREREDIRIQQELIVQETYLGEERARVEKEKEEATAKFDAELEDLELQLEEVRGKKLSFQ